MKWFILYFCWCWAWRKNFQSNGSGSCSFRFRYNILALFVVFVSEKARPDWFLLCDFYAYMIVEDVAKFWRIFAKFSISSTSSYSLISTSLCLFGIIYPDFIRRDLVQTALRILSVYYFSFWRCIMIFVFVISTSLNAQSIRITRITFATGPRHFVRNKGQHIWARIYLFQTRKFELVHRRRCCFLDGRKAWLSSEHQQQ